MKRLRDKYVSSSKEPARAQQNSAVLRAVIAKAIERRQPLAKLPLICSETDLENTLPDLDLALALIKEAKLA